MAKHKTAELVGKRFGNLTVFRVVKRHTHALVECNCGNRLVLPIRYFKRKRPRQDCLNCGFELKWPADSYHPEYISWRSMLLRCGYKEHQGYYRYGGRGIKVHKELETYEGFLRVLGKCPEPKWTVDRIDPDGDYAPNNVRWASPETQANNKSLKVTQDEDEDEDDKDNDKDKDNDI